MTVAEAFVTLRPDTKGFASDAEREVGTPLKKIAGVAAAAFAAVGVASIMKGAIGAASDMNETVSKSRTIFGPAAADIEKWASNSAKAFGQSKQGALDAAATFGNLFTQLKIAPDLAAKMSTQMVELASDFASFHNANPAEVIQAQTAAFRGEYDALQRFVPTINAAAVAQKAMEMTGKATTAALTDQDKALAVNALMMEGAGAAAGDFARTSDGLANKQRIQSAQWADLTAKIGAGLLPIMSALTTFIMERVIPAISTIAEWLGKNKDLILAVSIGIVAALVPGLIAWATSATTAAAASALLATVMAAIPVVALGLAIAALAYLVIHNWDTITKAFRVAKDFIVEHINTILIVALGPLGLAIVILKENWEAIWGAITRAVEVAWNIIRPIIDTMKSAIEKVTGLASKLPGGFLGGAANAIIPGSGFLPFGANGFRNFQGGPAVINEHRGGELLDIPRGSNLYSMGETNEIAGLLRLLLNATERQTSTNVRLART